MVSIILCKEANVIITIRHFLQALVDQLQVENHELRFGSVGGDPKGILATSSDAVGSLDKETILGGAAVLSDATKSFARRMKSNLMPDKSPSGVVASAAGVQFNRHLLKGLPQTRP